MKKNIILSTLTVILLSFTGCYYHEDIDVNNQRLDRTIFIEDPLAPNLPIYSELGYNTFGAYIDREFFRSSTTQLPSKIIVKNDTLNFLLTGESYLNSRDTLAFKINGVAPKTFEELKILKNQSIDLKSATTSVYLTRNRTTTKLEVIEGELNFKDIRSLIVDDELVKIIVPGTFKLKMLLNGSPTTIKSGRFDLGFSDDNFYCL